MKRNEVIKYLWSCRQKNKNMNKIAYRYFLKKKIIDGKNKNNNKTVEFLTIPKTLPIICFFKFCFLRFANAHNLLQLTKAFLGLSNEN